MMQKRRRPSSKKFRTTKPRPPHAKQKSSKKETAYTWAVSTLDGTQDLVRNELTHRLRKNCTFIPHTKTNEIHFAYTGPREKLLSLSTAQTLLLKHHFPISRPRTLLSPEYIATLIDLIQKSQRQKGIHSATGFRFDAAGSDSPTMQRIAQRIENQLHLPFDPENGDCVITMRPEKTGWEVLCRVGNRPLATRSWRKVDYPGSLNAAIASCMNELTRPKRNDRYLNLMCGSGTLLIERLFRQRIQTAVGIDISAMAISASRENIKAAGMKNHIQLITGDARATQLPDHSFDAITSDLPYGEQHGSQKSNATLYRDSLTEATRLCRPGGKMSLLTEDISSLRAILPELQNHWRMVDERTIVQRNHRPLCITFRKNE